MKKLAIVLFVAAAALSACGGKAKKEPTMDNGSAAGSAMGGSGYGGAGSAAPTEGAGSASGSAAPAGSGM